MTGLQIGAAINPGADYEPHIAWSRSKYRSALSGSTSRAAFAAASQRVRHDMGRPKRIEPLEPRILLSADSIIPGITASLAGIDDPTSPADEDGGLSELAEKLKILVDESGEFDGTAPGLRANNDVGDRLAPTYKELFSLDFAQLFGDPNNAPGALEGLDLNGDDVIDFEEAFQWAFVEPLNAFLDTFGDNTPAPEGQKYVADGTLGMPDGTNDLVSITISDFLNGYTDLGADASIGAGNNTVVTGLNDYLNSASASFTVTTGFGSSVQVIDFDINNAVAAVVDGSNIVFDLDLSLTFRTEYLIDLGAKADDLEISLPEDPVTLSTIPTVNVDASYFVPIEVSIATGSGAFSFEPTADLQFDIVVSETFTGADSIEVNVGFLGMQTSENGGAGTSSFFNLSIPFTAELIDPSSPWNIGFQVDDFKSDGDGEISSGLGVLTATEDLDPTFSQDIMFTLQVGAEGMDSYPAFDVTVDHDMVADNQDVLDEINAAINAAGLMGVLEASLDGMALQIALADSDASVFGFTGQEHFDNDGDLVAGGQILDNLGGAVDFMSDFDFEGALILSLNAGAPVLVTANFSVSGADQNARRTDFLDQLNAILNAAFGETLGANNVSADINNDGTGFTLAGLNPSDTLEITRTLTMAAEYQITASELMNAAAEDLFLIDIDPANDNFEIELTLDALPGVNLVGPGTLDGESYHITRDMVTDAGGGAVDFTNILTTDDAGFERFDGEIETRSADFDKLLEFAVLGDIEALSLLSQLKGWLDRLPLSDMVGDFDIPFTDGTLTELFQFGEIFQDDFLDDLIADVTDENGNVFQTPIFTTVQELGEELGNLGLLGSDGVEYNIDEQELTYHIVLDPPNFLGDAGATANIDYDLASLFRTEGNPLAPFVDISVEAEAAILAELIFEAKVGIFIGSGEPIAGDTFLRTLNADEGVDLNDTLSVTGALGVSQYFGRLSGDAHFAVSIDGGEFATVTVMQSVTNGNTTTAELIANINSAIAATDYNGDPLSDFVEAREVAGRIAIVAVDSMVENFAVMASPSDRAYTELGLRTSAASTVFLTGEKFDFSGLGGTVAFDLAVNGGAGAGGDDFTISIDTSGLTSLDQLLERLNNELADELDGDFAGDIVASRAGNQIVLAAVGANVSSFEVSDNMDASKIGLNLSGSDAFAGIFLTGQNFLDPDVNPAASSLSAFGRLDMDQSFDIFVEIDGGADIDTTVSITAALTSNNLGLQTFEDPNNPGMLDPDSPAVNETLIGDLNSRLAAAGLGGLVEARLIGGNRIGLFAVDPTVTRIQIDSDAPELGLFNDFDGNATTDLDAVAVAELRTVAATAAPSFYGPQSDATFTIYYTDGANPEAMQAITIATADASNNNTLFGLVNDVNRALNDAFGGASMNPFIAAFDGDRLVIQVNEARTNFDITAFRIEADAANAAVTDLQLFERTSVNTTADMLPAGIQVFHANTNDFEIILPDGTIYGIDVQDLVMPMDGDLRIDDVQESIETQTSNDVTAGFNDLMTGLKLTTSIMGDELFRVVSTNASGAVYQLGLQPAASNNVLNEDPDIPDPSILDTPGVIEGDAVSVPDFAERLFLRQVDSSTDFFTAELSLILLVPDDGATAKFGFVGVTLQSRDTIGDDGVPDPDFVIANVGFGLRDPMTDLYVLRDDPLSTDSNMDGVKDIFDLADVFDFPSIDIDPMADEIGFEVELAAGPVGDITLGATPDVVLTINNGGDPFNIPAGALAGVDAQNAVSGNVIDFGFNHGFETGNEIVYRNGGGVDIGGLEDGETYYVIVESPTQIRLATLFNIRALQAAIENGDPVNNADFDIDLTVGAMTGEAGDGLNHRFQGFNPILPSVSVDTGDVDLEALVNFENVSFDNILSALRAIADILSDIAGQDFLNEEIPILGVSFGELLDIADGFVAAVDDIANNPPATLQELTQKVLQSFGLPPDASPFEFQLVDDGDGADGDMKDMLQLTFDFGRMFSEALDFNFNLLEDDTFGLISLVGNTGLGASGGIDLKLTVGVDLDEDAMGDQFGEVFLFIENGATRASANLSASSADVNFNASIGPLGAAILGGNAVFTVGADVVIDDSVFSNIQVVATDQDAVSIFNPGAMDPFAGLAEVFDAIGIDIQNGGIDVILPVYFPTQSDFIGDITFSMTIDSNGFGTPMIGFPSDFELDGFFENFDIFTSIPLLIDAIDLLLETVQDAVSGQLFGEIDLPFIGDTLSDAAEFIGDIRSGFIQPFITLFENTSRTGDQLGQLLQGFIFTLLGPGWDRAEALSSEFDALFAEIGGLVDDFPQFTALRDGLDLLGLFGIDTDAFYTTFFSEFDADVSGLAGQALFDAIEAKLDELLPFDLVREVPTDLSSAITGVEWQLNLSDSINPAVNTAFDFGFPGLGLDLAGGLALELGYEFGIGFGVNFDDGAYIDVSRADELRIFAAAGFTPGSEITGRLGFLQLSASQVDAGGDNDLNDNGIHDNTELSAEFTVDIQNRSDPMDPSTFGDNLSFFDIGNIYFQVGAETSAKLLVDLDLRFNEEILPDVVSAILPALTAQFEFMWSWSVDDFFDPGQSFDLGGSIDVVAFHDIGVDIGSFFSDFLGGFVGKIQEVTEPFQEIIDIITAPIPVISDLAGKPISLVDIAAAFGEFDPGLIYALADLITFVNSIDAVAGENLVITIKDHLYLVGAPMGADPGDVLGGGGFDFNSFLGDQSSNISNAISEGPLAGALDSVGTVLDGLLGEDGLLDGGFDFGGVFGGGDTANLAQQTLSGGFNTGQGGFAFPFLEDPSSILGALFGKPFVLVTYDLPPLVVAFSWEQAFPIYPPLYGSVGAGIELIIDLAFGYDTLGVQRLVEGNFENPLDLFAGLFISDGSNPDGSGADVPELQFTGIISVGAQLNAGVASAGVNADIGLTVNFDLNDPDGDGRVRLDELAGNFIYEFENGSVALAPLAIFDITGEVFFQLSAFIEVLLVEISFDITPRITLFEFEIEFERAPILATERGDGAVLINIGPNSASRLHGNLDDIGEMINVRQLENGDFEVWSSQFGVSEANAQRYSGDRLVIYGGEGADTIVLENLTSEFEIIGGSGNDTITATGGMGPLLNGDGDPVRIIDGGVGDDMITGGDADEMIVGGEGNDMIVGGGGADLIFGDLGRVSQRLWSGQTGNKDGMDDIAGGLGNDTIFGGGNDDTIGGESKADAGNRDDDGGPPDDDWIFGDGGRIVFLDDAGMPIMGGPEIRSTESFADGVDIIEGHGGADNVWAGRGDDSVDGGFGDDTIRGESGFDFLEGAGDSDDIFGGTEDDFIYGHREVMGGVSMDADGGDHIEGNDGNDFIRGNLGDDTIDGGRGTDIIFGDADDDEIVAGSGLDYVFGGADDDTVSGGTGNDIVFGDDGLVVFFDFDTLPGSANFSAKYARPGNLIGDADGDGADDRLIGDAPVPTIAPFTPDALGNTLDLIVTVVDPDDGDDFVDGGEGDDIVLGGAGGDEIFGDFITDDPPEGPIPADDDILIGDAGRIEFFHRVRDRILSVPGIPMSGNMNVNDTLSGNGGEDVLIGGAGMDTLFGRLDDAAFAGLSQADKDRIEAGDAEVSDNDVLIGDDGVIDYATVQEEAGSVFYHSSLLFIETTIGASADGDDDELYGSRDNDTMFGGAADDLMFGDVGEDVAIGDNGRIDYLVEESMDNPDFPMRVTDLTSRIELVYATDTTNATGGMDTISGAEENDIVIGGANADVLTGGDEDDIILGDNGLLDYRNGADPARLGLDLIRTDMTSLLGATTYDVGGNDTISGGGRKDIAIGGAGDDYIFGDDNLGADPNFLMTTPDAMPDEDILIGDQADVVFNDDEFAPGLEIPAIVYVDTTDFAESDGGSDTIEGNEAIDVVFGGVQGDVLRGNEDDDIVVGDEGLVWYDENARTLLAQIALGVIPSMSGEPAPFYDDNIFTVDIIETTDPDLGGADTIFGNENEDIAIGGTDADDMYGDNDFDEDAMAFVLEAEFGSDVLVGDQGKVSLINAVDPVTMLSQFAENITRVESTDALEADGGSDNIEGNDGADIIIGGVAGDRLHGEAADVSLVGSDMGASLGGEDVILGDEGIVRFDVLPSEMIDGAGDETAPGVSNNATLDLIRTFKTGMMSNDAEFLGGQDTIFGNDHGDVAMGGTDSDIIYGDLFANDFITLVDSDTPGADTLLGDGGEMRFTDFTIFAGALNADHVTILQTIEVAQGGEDTIEGNEGGDVIMGGAKGDILFGESDDYLGLMATGGAGNDIILGDQGLMNWILAGDVIDNRPDVSMVTLDPDRATLDLITTKDPTIGGSDRIEGNGASDTIFGGTTSDLIWGDTPDDDPLDGMAEAGDFDMNGDPLDGPDGADLIFGDHGKAYPNIPLNIMGVPVNAGFGGPSGVPNNNYFFSIDTQKADDGDDDIIFGGKEGDVALGGQGDDLIFGEEGDDDLIGGHNVMLGDDEIEGMDQSTIDALKPMLLADLDPTQQLPLNDVLDGGDDDDVIAGDNAVVIRNAANDSPRFRLTDGAGDVGELYNLTSQNLANIAQVDVGFTANVTDAFQQHLDQENTVRTVYLLDHNDDTIVNAFDDFAGGVGDDRQRFGNDIIVGGLNDDELFGQLGDDIIQGDGELRVVDVNVGPLPAAETYNPDFNDAAFNASFDLGDDFAEAFDIDGFMTRLTFRVAENIDESAGHKDGNDYIEGNGGNDRIYGGLGQDDIVGGSSSLFLFGESTAEDRPDGADLIFGAIGAGDVLARNTDGSLPAGSDVTASNAHGRDADVILGDNGNIYQIVTGPGVAASYQFDDESGVGVPDDGHGNVHGETGYAEQLRVRAVEFEDYEYRYEFGAGIEDFTLVFDDSASAVAFRGAGDLVFGETGDDIIHGMTGNDVLYGNVGDDDLYGEIGTDVLFGGSGRDGVLGDDGIILTSRNNIYAEPLNGVGALDPDEGPLKANEEPNLNSLNVVITTPGNIQIEVINREHFLTKSVELFAFRTDDVELSIPDILSTAGVRFNDIIYGGTGSDFLHGGDGDDAISAAEALPTYYNGLDIDGDPTDGSLTDVNEFLEQQQATANIGMETGDPGFSDLNERPFWHSFALANPGDILRFGDRDPNEFALYDEFFPRRKIILDAIDTDMDGIVDVITEFGADDLPPAGSIDFLLNFDPSEGVLDQVEAASDDMPGDLFNDGDDVIFGDLGNDWIVGGTGRDHAYGGRGSDILNMDDDHDSGAASPNNPNKGIDDQIENTQSDEAQAYADIFYGGAGRDVLILNTGADRAIDWVGEFNSYLVPFSPFGAFHISRTLQPQLEDYLEALSDSDGADVSATPDAGLLPSVVDGQLYVEQKLADVRTDDPDLLRNFEPFGELGQVRQEDRDWGDQTGAPDDPQPGNFQGKREIMRRELFNDTTQVLFADITGDFEVQNGKYKATPDFVGDEAKAVFHLDAVIGNYVEILTDVVLEKDKQGYFANGYIIFDYHNEFDYKFAGINAKTNKIEIGHYDETGWHVDAQSPKLFKPGTNYELTLALHGMVATIIVDGGNATSFTFGDALKDGLVGLGTDNAVAYFDNYQVQQLPPVITLTDTDDFAGGSSFTPLAGDWSVAADRFSSTAGGEPSVALKDFDVQLFSRIWIEATLNTNGAGGVVFDYSESTGFYKFAMLDANTDELLIGHYAGGGMVIDGRFDFDVVEGQDYDIKVELIGGSVSVEVDGAVVGGHIFASLLNDGRVGVVSNDGATSFEQVTLKTDDPQYAEAEALSASSPAVSGVGADQVLSAEALADIVAAAQLRWAQTGLVSFDEVSAIGPERFVIADLAGDLLGQHQANGAILIDGTAAGYGWYVDPTPLDDLEFNGRGGQSAAAGMDLLSVVMHEMSHALGFDHDAPGAGELTAETLAVGERLAAPVLAFSADAAAEAHREMSALAEARVFKLTGQGELVAAENKREAHERRWERDRFIDLLKEDFTVENGFELNSRPATQPPLAVLEGLSSRLAGFASPLAAE